MKFKEIEHIENLAASEGTNLISNFKLEMISEYLEKEERKSKAKDNPFVFFYEDVMSSSLDFNFQKVLGAIIFKNASDDAKTCLATCTEFYKLSSWAVSGWLQNALKFTDNIVLHYIQDCCKEIPKSYSNAGIEKSRYIHLSEKDGDKYRDIAVAGSELKDLYDLRNNLEHRTIIYPNGTQELISPKLNSVRQVVVKLFPDALMRILKTYKRMYPS